MDERDKMINEIIDKCDKLPANGTIVIQDYGKLSLTLNIFKDEDFNLSPDGEYNLVDVISQKDGEPMDDVIDAHVTDGTLYRELDRLWDGENLSLIP